MLSRKYKLNITSLQKHQVGLMACQLQTSLRSYSVEKEMKFVCIISK